MMMIDALIRTPVHSLNPQSISFPLFSHLRALVYFLFASASAASLARFSRWPCCLLLLLAMRSFV
jgi:hypothetical protein